MQVSGGAAPIVATNPPGSPCRLKPARPHRSPTSRWWRLPPTRGRAHRPTTPISGWRRAGDRRWPGHQRLQHRKRDLQAHAVCRARGARQGALGRALRLHANRGRGGHRGANSAVRPCRKLLWEYCGDIDIILGNLIGPTGRLRLSALLPMPFDRRLLG